MRLQSFRGWPGIARDRRGAMVSTARAPRHPGPARAGHSAAPGCHGRGVAPVRRGAGAAVELLLPGRQGRGKGSAATVRAAPRSLLRRADRRAARSHRAARVRRVAPAGPLHLAVPARASIAAAPAGAESPAPALRAMAPPPRSDLPATRIAPPLIARRGGHTAARADANRTAARQPPRRRTNASEANHWRAEARPAHRGPCGHAHRLRSVERRGATATCWSTCAAARRRRTRAATGASCSPAPPSSIAPRSWTRCCCATRTSSPRDRPGAPLWPASRRRPRSRIRCCPTASPRSASPTTTASRTARPSSWPRPSRSSASGGWPARWRWPRPRR